MSLDAQICEALRERFPMIDAEKAAEMAVIAAAVVSEPNTSRSGLKLCRVCKAPVRERAA